MENKTIYYKPSPPKPATLLILENGNSLKLLSLVDSASLGREVNDNSIGIKLQSNIVSRKHGEFICADGKFYYRDNGSLNGTYYNGNKMEIMNELGSKAVELKDGDVLRIDRKNLGVPHPQAVMILFSTSFNIDDEWKRFPLNASNIPIGRNINNGISLTDFMVSKNHAILNFENGNWKIIDNGSTNGIAVNKTMVQEHTLRPMDIIRIANTTLIFLGNEVIYNDIKLKNNNLEKSIIMNVNINEVKVRKHNSLSKKVLLKDINIDVETSDFILVLGGAGAGKSTFIKALMGEIRANGKITFDGMDLYKNFKMLKHKIGVVPQFSTTRANDTVYNTIMDAAKIKLSGEYSQKEIVARVDEVIQRMMLTKIKDSLISVISGGQKKRVEVAIQAIGDQSIFILDEPDSGLDVAGRLDQMRNLKTCTETGCVVAVITHYPDDAANLFTKVVVLAKSKSDDTGHLAYYGSVSNALSFFGVNKLSEIVLEINDEGGKGRADEFIEKYQITMGGAY